MELNAEFKQLFSFGEQFGNDEASRRVGYSLEMRRWMRDVARDYVLEVKDLSQARSVRRLVMCGDDAEGVGKATMVNERIKRIQADFETQPGTWWGEIVFIVGEAVDATL